MFEQAVSLHNSSQNPCDLSPHAILFQVIPLNAQGNYSCIPLFFLVFGCHVSEKLHWLLTYKPYLLTQPISARFEPATALDIDYIIHFVATTKATGPAGHLYIRCAEGSAFNKGFKHVALQDVLLRSVNFVLAPEKRRSMYSEEDENVGLGLRCALHGVLRATRDNDVAVAKGGIEVDFHPPLRPPSYSIPNPRKKKSSRETRPSGLLHTLGRWDACARPPVPVNKRLGTEQRLEENACAQVKRGSGGVCTRALGAVYARTATKTWTVGRREQEMMGKGRATPVTQAHARAGGSAVPKQDAGCTVGYTPSLCVRWTQGIQRQVVSSAPAPAGSRSVAFVGYAVPGLKEPLAHKELDNTPWWRERLRRSARTLSIADGGALKSGVLPGHGHGAQERAQRRYTRQNPCELLSAQASARGLRELEQLSEVDVYVASSMIGRWLGTEHPQRIGTRRAGVREGGGAATACLTAISANPESVEEAREREKSRGARGRDETMWWSGRDAKHHVCSVSPRPRHVQRDPWCKHVKKSRDSYAQSVAKQ
ncbi:hypothetical protein K438DRAFT_1765628 [Mycena galopus ATCC 62051]|nr:hypothetical protein K438DRAFT_1765628 [Mycena galopus ATCC 62051]